MKSDFSRISFDAARQYTGVLHQQGRVQTDADANEEAAIHAHFREALASSLTGTEGAVFYEPSPFKPLETLDLPGFRLVPKGLFGAPPPEPEGDPEETHDEVVAAPGGLEAFAAHSCWISPGHYYADGLRCENEAWVPLDAQPFPPKRPLTLPENPANPERIPTMLFYLDAWERPLSFLDEASIRDIALGAGVDTAMRARLVWQVNAVSFLAREQGSGFLMARGLPKWIARLPWMRARPKLKVQIDPGRASSDPCRPEQASAWQGLENQLYRVEIHSVPGKKGLPTFKWSRENGSVVAKVTGRVGEKLRIFPSQPKGGGFRPGDWLEIVKPGDDQQDVPGAMVRVASLRGDLLTLEKSSAAAETGDKLRRWDQRSCDGGVLPVKYGWVDLEDGIQVCFMPSQGDPEQAQDGTVPADRTPARTDTEIFAGTVFAIGDYWTFTARTAIASVEWPDETAADPGIPADVSARFAGVNLSGILYGQPVPVRSGGQPPPPTQPRKPAALPPHGVRHRYAVLALASWRKLDGQENASWHFQDLRRILSLTKIVPDSLENPPPDGAPPPQADEVANDSNIVADPDPIV